MKTQWMQASLAIATVTFFASTAAAATGCGVMKADQDTALSLGAHNHKVILDNDIVRVLDATVPAHTTEPAHTHIWPGVLIADQSGPGELPFQKVDIRWSDAGARKPNENKSDRGTHNIRIDIKNSDCKPVANPQLPATDGVVIKDPGIKVALENDYVRVLSVTVPPGEKEPWHTHTWQAVVVYFRLPPSQRFAPDGKVTPRAELKEMQITFDPNSQPSHSIENLGKVTYQAYRVELKPTTKVPVK